MNEAQALVDRCQLDPDTGCWEWTGARVGKGYGMVKTHPVVYAHRLMWELINDSIPDGHFVCHSCDNRLCINPEHLWVGAASDNVRDMHRKGRGNTSLNPELVQKIRQAHTPERTIASVAREFGVGWNAVNRLIKGHSWSYI